MKQPNLFGAPNQFGAYEPLAAKADPPTSHEAAAAHQSSGKLGVHAAIALALVKRHPGKTYQELFALARPEEKFKLGDPTELMRRLSGLKHGYVRQGPARVCEVGGRRCVTWEVV